MSKRKKIFVILFSVCAIIGLILGIAVFCIDMYVQSDTEDAIVEADTITGEYDCIFVLGCGIRTDGSPSHMLRDRLDTAYLLYELGVSDYILCSGDNSKVDYDEVGAMKDYLMELGVPEEAIYMDHAGFSTYESAYRAKAIFGIEKMVIVTQKYHLYRALYDAKDKGIEAVGVSADLAVYQGQTMRDLREIVARVKDYFFCIFDPKPTYLGEQIVIGEK